MKNKIIDVTKLGRFFHSDGTRNRGLEKGVAVFSPTEDKYEGYPQRFYKGRKTTLPMVPREELKKEDRQYERNQKYKNTYSKMERMG